MTKNVASIQIQKVATYDSDSKKNQFNSKALIFRRKPIPPFIFRENSPSLFWVNRRPSIIGLSINCFLEIVKF